MDDDVFGRAAAVELNATCLPSLRGGRSRAPAETRRRDPGPVATT
jgi:hypothetical protein